MSKQQAASRDELLLQQMQTEQIIMQRATSANSQHMLNSHGFGFALLCQPGSSSLVGPGLLLELADCSIAWLLQQNGALASDLTKHIIKHVLKGLVEAGNLGVICRDIKPANLLVFGWPSQSSSAQFTVKIADFGLAKICSEIADFGTSLVGTPAFMAPEVLDGALQLPASDWYSTGEQLLGTAKLID